MATSHTCRPWWDVNANSNRASNTAHSCTPPLPTNQCSFQRISRPLNTISQATSSPPPSKMMRPYTIPPPPLARRLTDPLDAPPPPHHDDAASQSLWAAEYASSDRTVVVAIDLGLAALLGIFLFVVWRQWRKGKKNRMAVDAEAAKGGRSGSVASSSSSEQQKPGQVASGMEKDEVVVVVVAADVAEPEEIHKKGGK